MSVLSFPRIYFAGFMCWDPATGNNNDYFPTYDNASASLNWPFLAPLGIDQGNFRHTFRPWATTVQTIDDTVGIPAEWNYFGGNACYFVQYTDAARSIDRKSLITGGMLGLGERVATDPLFGKPIRLIGDSFGSPQPDGPGRLVDVNPVSVHSGQIYYNSMSFGDAATGFDAPRACRMQSRFINFTRNFNLPRAGAVSVTWQASFAASQGLKFRAGRSRLLAALESQIESGKAKGLMVRFNTYLNLYCQNGYFNDFQPQPRSEADLPALYEAALANKIDLFSNPCYSRIVGTVGPWYDDELATAPEGRYLAPPANIVLCNPRASSPCWNASDRNGSENAESMAKGGPQSGGQPSGGTNPINVPTAAPRSNRQLGVAVAEIDYRLNVISVDLLNTFPEWFWQGDKVDFGEIAVGAQNGGAFTKVATLPFSRYGELAYEQSGGIADLPFDPKFSSILRDGLLTFQVGPAVWVALSGPDGKLHETERRSVLVEQALCAQTDQRGIYLNEGEGTGLTVSIKLKGRPASGARLLVVKYNPPDGLAGPNNPIPADAPQVVDIVNGDTRIIGIAQSSGPPIQTRATTVEADANGRARLELRAASPGFPVLVFYPYQAGQAAPPPLSRFSEALTSMFATIRVLPFDDALVDRFVTLWNSTFDPAEAWNFVYSNILYLYDMIFPVMIKSVPLSDRGQVEAVIDQVLMLVSPQYFDESTLAMPITRDLSSGKRTVLELWGGLVKKNYPPQPITKPAPMPASAAAG